MSDPAGGVLQLPGYTLRPWLMSDVEDLLKAFGDASIREFAVSPIDTVAEARQYVERRTASWADGTSVSWAVTDAATGTVLGNVTVHVVRRPLDTGMVGYWLLPRGRGRGAATNAVRAGAAYAFEHLALHRIELAHSVENVASCGVATRAGFPYEGTLRDAMRFGGGPWRTEHLHARLATDED